MTLAEKRARKKSKRAKLKLTFKSSLGDLCWAQREAIRREKDHRKRRRRQKLPNLYQSRLDT